MTENILIFARARNRRRRRHGSKEMSVSGGNRAALSLDCGGGGQEFIELLQLTTHSTKMKSTLRKNMLKMD